LIVLVLIGLTIEYWYIALPLLVLTGAVGLAYHSKQQKEQKQQKLREEEIARHRPGPRDPWLNEIAVALADFELTEFARNTGSQVAGVPIEGDIRLDADRFSVIITLFANGELARQAEIGLRAKPEVRAAIAEGKSIVSAEDLILYVANGRGGVVDESRLSEVVQIVSGIPVGPPRTSFVAPAPQAAPAPPPSAHITAAAPSVSADVLDLIKRLAELRDSGVLSDAEFEAKKAELLRRF
jgi:hypothetical protein